MNTDLPDPESEFRAQRRKEPDQMIAWNSFLWRHDENLKAVMALLPEIKLLSLDVFDTLLLRACAEPHDIFLETGRRAKTSGAIPYHITPEEYRAVRIYAMDRAYRLSSTEPCLEEILRNLPPGLGNSERMAQLELATEKEYCYLNPSIVSLLHECKSRGIRIVLLSDMYLGRNRVEELLAAAGFRREWADQIWVSVDQGVMKAQGTLYRKLLDTYTEVKPVEVLHIGDNPASDVDAARREGIQAHHYDTVRSDANAVMSYERARHGEILPGIQALRSLAMSMGGNLQGEDRLWFRVGAGVLGPFLAAFCDWVVETAEKEGIDVIAPFMREAVTLSPLLDRAVRDRGLNIRVIPLFVSREAVVLAGTDSMDSRSIRSLFENREYFSVRDLFRSLELGKSLGRFGSHAETYLGQAWSVPFTPERTLLQELEEFLSEPVTRTRIEAVIRRRRHGLVSYVERSLGGNKCALTVDLGFLGQIQSGLDSALRQENQGIRLVHLLAFGKANFGQLLGRGLNIRAFAGSAGSNQDLIETIHRSAPVLEQLLMGREGSTVGYTNRSRTAFEPDLESNPMEEWEHTSKDILRQGVFGYQELWLHFRRTKPSIAAEIMRDKQGWCRLLHRLIDMPTSEEARLIGNLHNDCNFGSSRTVQICPPDEEESIRQMGAYEYYRFMRHKSPAVWPQGSITRVDPGVILAHYCSQSDTGYFERMLAFCRSLTASGIMKVVVYGAGVVGRNFIRAARLSGLSVLCAVDRNAQLWGTCLEGIDVMSLEAAISAGNHHYAVASFAFSGEIRDAIQAAYRGLSPQPKIFMPGHDVSHEASRHLRKG